ncbi:MAG: hypothetical protein LKI18_08165 [Prevotella sp.]|jgi:uncharacterized protein (DUF1778 family)|nr:hypothetical protein [Prevotella sp.]
MKNNSKKSKRLDIRIFPKQEMMIKQKAENYKSLSNMILDVIQQFDGTGRHEKNRKAQRNG